MRIFCTNIAYLGRVNLYHSVRASFQRNFLEMGHFFYRRGNGKTQIQMHATKAALPAITKR